MPGRSGDIAERAAKLGISERLFTLLTARGISEEEVPAFLRPSLSALTPPGDIPGMTEAAARLRRAVDAGEKILVFGDYDCDGICAVCLLMLALRGRADVSYFIPNRLTDGYGMSMGALRSIVAERRPDLVITVDCGITAAPEVEYLKSEGIDVIVTDHHEPQDSIPDCIVVDPKTDRKCFSDYCGAGVALQLVRALFGEEYRRYLDICALATVADVVPLRGDNRIIAAHGIAAHNASPRKGLKMLAGDKLTSQDIMFRVAPRINAAGRLGSASKVADLFLEEDYFLLKTLTEELERDNARRQEVCEQVVSEAKAMLRGTDFSDTHIIVLHSPHWEAGVLGIAAARLTEDFLCPAVLLTGEGSEYKGSARSVEGVNIFRVLSEFSDRFTSFGGHAQAAGLTVKAEEYEEFVRDITAYIAENFAVDTFMPHPRRDMSLTPDTDFLAFARELELLEPTGYGNPRPVFGLSSDEMRFKRVGFGPHVKYASGDLELMGFSRYEWLLAAGKSGISADFGMETAVFRNRLYAQGVLKEALLTSAGMDDKDALMLSLGQLKFTGKFTPEEVSAEEVRRLLSRPFGTAIVVFDRSEYDRLCARLPEARRLPVFLSVTRRAAPVDQVIVAPSADFDFGYFSDVVIAGRALTEGYLKHIAESAGRCVSFGAEPPRAEKVSDDELRHIYSAYAAAARTGARYVSPEALTADIAARAGVSVYTAGVSALVLSELGLISVSDRGMISVSGTKTDLSRSVVYSNVRR